MKRSPLVSLFTSPRPILVVGLVLIVFPPPAFAQDPERWYEGRPAPPVHFHDGSVRAEGSQAPHAVADPELDRLAGQIAAAVLRLYGEALRNAAAPPLDCRDPVGVAGHQRALRSLGRAPDCLRWVDTCERQHLPGTPGLERVLWEGARCASADYQYSRAHELHDRATQRGYTSSDVYPGMVYVFARFAYLSQYQSEVPGILARNPAWAGSRLPVVRGALEYMGNGYTTLASESAVRSEVAGWMADGDPVLQQVALVDWAWDLMWNRGRDRDSARFFAEKAGVLASPQEWWSTAYSALHRAATFQDFTPARRVYDVALPYLHPLSPLPVARNTYTYSDLYGRVCSTRLTSGPARESYETIRRDWLGGGLPASQAHDRALRLLSTAGENADVLTLLGGLAEDLERDDQARDWYWRAHQACPYYNRAHDGLGNVSLRRLARAWSDRETFLARADREIRAARFTTDVRHFVKNWSSLAGVTLKQVLHGLRLWAPYLDFLLDSDARIYFKRAPERTSDIEGLADVRDRRYFDNRLYDDIGGLAVNGFAVIHLASAAENPSFGGDITAHEVAHLFHVVLPSAQRSCITALFGRASARRLFSDPYASTNEWEYFAVGAEVFLTPPDAPPRFGQNVDWLRRNDADLLRFLEQIGEGRPPSTLTCPLS